MKVQEEMLIYAFRYCLGRQTYAVKDCVECIIDNWDNISTKAKTLFHKEIKEHESEWGTIGSKIDTQQWYRILSLTI